MKIKYAKENLKDFRQINFYQKDEDKKIDDDKNKYLNFKLDENLNLKKFILLIRSVVSRAKQHKQEKISFDFSQLRKIKVEDLEDDFQRAKIFLENLIIGEYKFDKYLSEKKGRIKEILIFGNFTKEEKEGFKEGEIFAEATNKARDLANEPGGSMTPTILANEVKKIFRGEKKVSVKILDESETKKLKMGLFNAVGQGSDEKSKFIVVEYKGGDKKDKNIVLVGKGVTFDSGGMNLKLSNGLEGMNMDMTGGATVLSALYGMVKLGVKKNVVVLVPAVENSLSGKSIRTGDIVKSFSGKTVQINNTDAEGRLVLADAITYAKKYKPEVLIDVATLTGASLIAVGQRATVVMSNDIDLENQVRKIGEKVGEYFWPLPAWDDFLEDMKTPFADLSNISKVRWGGTITAGIFLKEFVKDLGEVKWAHLDIAPRMESISSDNLEKGATGEPVKTLIELVRNY